MTVGNIWTCKIGGSLSPAIKGADAPMRRAVEIVYHSLVGVPSQFNFSGWGGSLTYYEKCVLEGISPRFVNLTPEQCRAECIDFVTRGSINDAQAAELITWLKSVKS